ncbi:MAG: hypothetical protein AAF458_21215 [Pseudomonadota bacterium]
MNGLLTGLLAAIIALAVAVFIWRKRRSAGMEDSSYGRWKAEQRVTWSGRPVTVIFDYAAYLQEPARRKVNVHTVQVSAMGEQSVLGFCHDGQEDRIFKLSGIRGAVLVDRSKEELDVDQWLARLVANDTFLPDLEAES